MKNKTDDGVFCDYCGDQVKNDFIYYSFDFKEITIANKLQRASGIILSADLCERCMELFRLRLLDTSKQRASGVKCDVTGEDLGINDQTYYCCDVSKVEVNMSAQPYKCVKCGKPRNLEDGPCDCSQDKCEIRRDADIKIDDKYVRLNFSPTIYGKFRGHLNYIKGIGDAEWTK